MFGTYVCGFVLALFLQYSLSVFFIKRKRHYGIWTQTVASRRIWRKIHVATSASTFPFDIAVLAVLIFVKNQEIKAWLALVAVIFWAIMILIVSTVIFRRETKSAN